MALGEVGVVLTKDMKWDVDLYFLQLSMLSVSLLFLGWVTVQLPPPEMGWANLFVQKPG